MPFQLAGGVVNLGQGRFLVSGYTPPPGDTAFVCRIELDASAGTVLVRETMSYPGFGWDLYGLAWNPTSQILAFVDVTPGGQAIRYAPWSGWPAVATDPALPIATSVLSALSTAEVPTLTGSHVAISPDQSGSGFRVFADTFDSGTLVQPDANAWTVSRFSMTVRPAWWHNRDPGHSNFSVFTTSEDVSIATPELFSVIQVSTGLTVLTGSQSQPNVPFVTPLVQAFHDDPGAAFKIIGATSDDSAEFRPLVRYGRPFESGIYRPGKGSIESEKVVVGGGPFVVHSGLTIDGLSFPDSPTATPTPVTTLLWIAFGSRGPGAPADPVVLAGDYAILNATISLQIPHAQLFPDSGCGITLPAVGPGLEDLILLCQLVYVESLTPSSIAYTDVIGTRIFPAVVGGSAAPASASRTSSTQDPAETSRRRERAIRDWMDSIDRPQQSAEELRSLRNRMLRRVL